jgi:hypothetical protein
MATQVPLASDGRTARQPLPVVLLWTSWILTGAVALPIVAFPALTRLFTLLSRPGHADWPKFVLTSVGILWVFDFAYNKIIGAVLLICAISVIVNSKVPSRTKVITSGTAVIVCAALWLWATRIHF